MSTKHTRKATNMTPEQEAILRQRDEHDAVRIAELLRNGREDFLSWLREKPSDGLTTTGAMVPGERVGFTKEPGVNPLSNWLKERSGRRVMLASNGTWRLMAARETHRLDGWAKRLEARLSQHAQQVDLTATQMLGIAEESLRGVTDEDVASVAERFPIQELEGALPT